MHESTSFIAGNNLPMLLSHNPAPVYQPHVMLTIHTCYRNAPFPPRELATARAPGHQHTPIETLSAPGLEPRQMRQHSPPGDWQPVSKWRNLIKRPFNRTRITCGGPKRQHRLQGGSRCMCKQHLSFTAAPSARAPSASSHDIHLASSLEHPWTLERTLIKRAP